MTTGRKTKSSKGAPKKLKLKKETIKNLNVRPEAGDVKGGMPAEPTRAFACTANTCDQTCRCRL
jgi:hypothetical protein